MKYKKMKNTVISKVSAMLLVLALCMSLVLPMAGMNVYAESEDTSIIAEESTNDADIYAEED